MIYFAQTPNGGPIKIGTSSDPEGRCKGLESYYGCPLVILATMEGGREEEREIHERFAYLRFGRTEQFRPAPDLMEFIGLSVPDGLDPDLVEPMDTPGASDLIMIKLQVTEAERDRLRVVAANSPHRNMALWCRDAVRKAMEAAEKRK